MTTLINIPNFQCFTLTNELLFIEIIKSEKMIYIEYKNENTDNIRYDYSIKKLIKMLKKTKLYYFGNFQNPMFMNLDKIKHCYIHNKIIYLDVDTLDDDVVIHFKSSKNAKKAFYKLHKAMEKRLNCHNNLLNEIKEMLYFHPPCDGGTGYQNSLKEFVELQ